MPYLIIYSVFFQYMVGMPWNSCFFRGAEPCIIMLTLLLIMLILLISMLILLIIMLIILIIKIMFSIVRTMLLIVPCI